MANNHQFEERLERHMDEMRRLHGETLRAADRVEGAADRAEKTVEKLEVWVTAISKKVSALEHFKTASTVGGVVILALLKDKIGAILGLKVVP